jgi:hypothetical protein
MKSTDIKELQKWLINLTKEKYIHKADIKQILNDFDWDGKSFPLDAEVKPESGGLKKEIITYALSEPFNGDWYDMAEYETLKEAKKQYNTKTVAAIVEKRVNVAILFKKG